MVIKQKTLDIYAKDNDVFYILTKKSAVKYQLIDNRLNKINVFKTITDPGYLSVSENQKMFAVGVPDGKIAVYDTEKPESRLIFNRELNNEFVQCLSQMYFVADDTKILFSNVESGIHWKGNIFTLDLHTNKITKHHEFVDSNRICIYKTDKNNIYLVSVGYYFQNTDIPLSPDLKERWETKLYLLNIDNFEISFLSLFEDGSFLGNVPYKDGLLLFKDYMNSEYILTYELLFFDFRENSAISFLQIGEIINEYDKLHNNNCNSFPERGGKLFICPSLCYGKKRNLIFITQCGFEFGELYIIDLSLKKVIKRLQIKYISSIALTSDETKILIGTWDNLIIEDVQKILDENFSLE